MVLLLLFWVGVAVAQDAERGAYLAAVAGCVSCHTGPDGPRWAGGYALETDFGTFYGTNLTQDPDHGLGAWTEADFLRAMRRGRSPRGRPYYPSFPYPSYTGMTEEDLRDLWAFLETLEPLAVPNRDHEVRGLYGWRFLLRFWKLFEFRRGPFDAASEDPVLARGAYLVDAVGHCGECHTPRNGIGGLRPRHYLAGSDAAPAPSPNITPHPDGVEGWGEGDWRMLLEIGMLPDGDFVGQQMGDIVDEGTSRLTPKDQEAMIRWLLAVEPRPTP